MVYHEAMDKVVILAIRHPVNETWLWDGSNLSLAPQLGAPTPGRSGAGLVYDKARGRAVLFGGGATSQFAETWELDTTGWALRNPATSPSARNHAAMGYDPVRQKTVLYGGYGTSVQPRETWEWDGVDWTQRFPAVSPPDSAYAFLSYMPALGGLVLYGAEPLNDLHSWLWDGTNWTQLSAQVPRPDTTGAPAATGLYDPRFKQLLMFYGTVGTPPDSIWRLHFDDLVSNNPYPRLGESFDLTVDLPSAGNHLALFALSGGRESGITLYRDAAGPEILPLEPDRMFQVSLGMWLNTILDQRGTGRVLLGVPNDPSLLWLRMYAAAVTVDLSRLTLGRATGPAEILVTR
jgi:hypothetical protein